MDIQQFCAQRNLPFGIIIDDLTAQNDDQYYNNTMNNLKFLQGIFGTNLGGMQVWRGGRRRGGSEEGWRRGMTRGWRGGAAKMVHKTHMILQKLFMSWNYDPPTPNNNIPESQFGTMTK